MYEMTRPIDQAATISGLTKVQFIALMAMLMSINAISIDIMLPGLQEIGASLGVADENHRQYVITAYLLGMGFAQLFFGPLSDRFGRRAPLLGGLALYGVSALAIVFVPTFGALLFLRLVQGIGAAATRVITVSVVRDVYGGRQMAEIMSLVMMVFMIVPVIAPSIGQLIMLFSEWHMIFVVIALFAVAVALPVALRLRETLAPANRRPFTASSILAGFRIVLTNRLALFYTLATSALLGALFGFINSAQQILVGVYGLGVWFPAVFAAFAGMMAVASFTNSRLVRTFGMRALSHAALLGFTLASFIWMSASLIGPLPLPLFMLLHAATMFQFGLIAANFNAMAMEPLGHVAGTASSVLGFTQTIGGGIIGAFIGQAFNNSVTPLAVGFFTVAVVALVCVLIAEGGKLFKPHNPAG
ncbi:multidrug effflux MFS transporter [Sinorhizobium meliloti]|uniref:multidrug effflux MFS transporter n=1 Tax=Rhizobium meliloti TaxID=382 RepID=UPI0003095AC7|nr:multidrug effflux MFS transporter [Sinorhizobium meliloti]MDE3797815.1 multidrug effflux MFS transporter [Sinorhizobium meliloti]MDE4601504.1 multidrug effflux MFS transporter [Sinorhizobium meliloti]QQF03009.1 multidrug effflux MFS transporter [Sinorhizobium meliloti]UDU17883.1 multidrug effflux MFS transporter [Sinorhizobium meliloti]